MTGLKVVYADRRESRLDGQDMIWVEYSGLQWLDETSKKISKSSALPLSLHIAPEQMRLDMIFPEHVQIAPKRLYMLAFSKSLAPSVSTIPISQGSDIKGILLTVQGSADNPSAMQDFLQSIEIRDILPEEAITLMLNGKDPSA
jgi:hypothetical protein